MDELLDKDDQHPNWQWLVSMMEVTAKARQETASFAPFIRQILPDPRIPF